MTAVKVLMATPYYHPRTGGLETYARHVVQGVRAAGHEVTVVCGDERVRAVTTTTDDGCTVHRLPVAAVVSNTPLHPAWPVHLRRILAAERPDLINAHTPVVFMVDMVCLAAGRTPVVVTYHAGSLDKQAPLPVRAVTTAYKPVQRLVLARADRIIAVSDFVRRRLPPGVRGKTRVVPNAVPPPAPLPRPPACPGPAGGGLVFIANLEPAHAWKGLDAVLDALALLRRDGAAPPRLTVIGDGADRPRYERRVREQGLAGLVTFAGRLTGAERDAEAARAAALVAYPTSANDAFPTVILEAWSLGLGVVAAAVGALPGIVADGETGVLVPPRSPAALAAVLRDVADGAVDVRAHGAAGRRLVADEFTWPRQVRRTLDVYEELLR